MPYKQEKKSFFSCLKLFFPGSDFFLLPQFFSPGSKASRKSGLTRTQIKTFSRSKVNPETVKKLYTQPFKTPDFPKTPKTQQKRQKLKKVAGVPGKYPEYPEYPRYLLDMCPGGPGNLRDLVGKMWEEEPLKFAWAGVQTTRNERHDHGCTFSVFYVP